MPSVQQDADVKVAPSERLSSVKVTSGLRWRLRRIATEMRITQEHLVRTVLEEYASEKERELGLPSQQGAA